jgi:Tfp pilus assembly protein PilO
MINELRARMEGLGWAGVAGIALAVFAVALYFFSIAPLERALAERRVEAAALQERLRMGEPIGREPKAGANEQLATFYSFFPASTSSPDWLGKIHAAATSKGLVLQSGEYKLERRPDQKLARYQITLPVTGSYGQIRNFLSEVLAEVPAAALEDITLKRESATSAMLEGRIRLTLYLGSA